MQRKRILFLVPHYPDRSPGQRFRFEQYLSFFKENGYDYEISNLISEVDDKKIYSPGNYLYKLYFLLKSFLIRWNDLKRVEDFDIVFIYREALMLGTTFFEQRIAGKKVKMILDFDDAVWMLDVSAANKKFAFLKKPSKTKEIIALCNAVIVGNEFLAEYSRQFNDDVFVIPTTIDTERYNHEYQVANEKIIIGWTGSPTTIPHFETIEGALLRIKGKYGDKVGFKVIGDPNYKNQALGISGQKWQSETEVEDLSDIDIGIMPLPDDKWSNGKCGCKGLQYMALGIPSVLSPVGVNKDIIIDGENGFLASNEDEWVDKLSRLIESADLRQQLGDKGEGTVAAHYSIKANRSKYLDVFDYVLNR